MTLRICGLAGWRVHLSGLGLSALRNMSVATLAACGGDPDRGRALAFGIRALAWLDAPLAALTTGLIGVYHAGVEQKLWAGPSTCTGGGPIAADLLSTDSPRLVMCDVISWQVFGLSMAA